MKSPRNYYVYIVASRSRTLYTGMTNNMARRLAEHRSGRSGTFAGKYRTTRLVFVESTTDVFAAIAREKQIKGWSRARKIALVESSNPGWDDLSEGWLSADSSLRSE